MRFAVIPSLLVIACTGSTVPSGTAPGDALRVLEGTEWIAVSLEGERIAGTPRITLEFEHDTLGGYGGCNWYGSDYEVDGSGIELGEVMSTARACVDPAPNDRETAYLNALRRTSRWRGSTNTLELLDSRGRLLVKFERRIELVMDPAALIETTWQLKSVDGAIFDDGPPITITFTQETMRGFAGCRNFTGTYGTDGDAIHVTSLSMTELECDDEDRMETEGVFINGLSESANWEVRGDELILTTHPGEKLVLLRR